MKPSKKSIVLPAFAALVACLASPGQVQAQTASPAGTVKTARGGGGGYVSGGERGSVVQVISDAQVQAELSLTETQQQKINEILDRVRTLEDELFSDFRRSIQERSQSARARHEQEAQKHLEAHQQLAGATQRILGRLSPAQRNQLQALCRQAATNAARPPAGIAPGGRPRGYGGGGSASASGGGFAGGGTTGGSARAGGSIRSFGGSARSVGGGSSHSSVGGGSSRGTAGGGGGGGGASPEHRSSASHEYASGGGPGGVVRVISNEFVQQQLGLNAQQRQQIGTILGEVNEFESRFFAEVRSAAPSRGREWYEQQKRKEDSAREAVARAGEEILQQLEPVQRQRLKEICLQAQGAAALFKPDVIQALGLTAAQQVRLSTLRQEAENRAAALHRAEGNLRQPAAASVPGSVAERLAALERESEQRMIGSVLTPSQQVKLQQMKGKSFAGIARFQRASSGGSGGGTASSSQQLR